MQALEPYILISLLQIIGVGLHAANKIAEIRKGYPDKSLNEILATFWHQDWNTLIVSALVAVLNLVGHYIMQKYGPDWISGHQYYHVASFALALLLGYFGQRKIYQWFGTAEKALDKKIDQVAG